MKWFLSLVLLLLLILLALVTLGCGTEPDGVEGPRLYRIEQGTVIYTGRHLKEERKVAICSDCCVQTTTGRCFHALARRSEADEFLWIQRNCPCSAVPNFDLFIEGPEPKVE